MSDWTGFWIGLGIAIFGLGAAFFGLVVADGLIAIANTLSLCKEKNV